MTYEAYLRGAERTLIEGWDFSALDNRMVEQPPPWDYRRLVTDHIGAANRLLDMGTGGGEFLASLDRLPAGVTATEGHPPNVEVAKRRLEPLGVAVVPLPEAADAPLPLPDNAFDLVINRHEYYDPQEVRRILAPGGVFVTQQVGGADVADLNTALAAGPPDFGDWTLDTARRQLTEAGFDITHAQTAQCRGEFRDIGAVLIYLKLVPWQIPGYDQDAYEPRLRALHDRITEQGPLTVSHHRFLLTARRPALSDTRQEPAG